MHAPEICLRLLNLLLKILSFRELPEVVDRSPGCHLHWWIGSFPVWVRLNETIRNDTTLGRHYMVGHSFFCPHGMNFSSLGTAWFDLIVKTEIVPLLDEYWFDAPEKVEAARQALLAPCGDSTSHGALIPIRNLWHMLLYAWNLSDFLGHWRGEVEAAPDLDGLIARLARFGAIGSGVVWAARIKLRRRRSGACAVVWYHRQRKT